MRETFLQAVIGSGLESDSLSKTNIKNKKDCSYHGEALNVQTTFQGQHSNIQFQKFKRFFPKINNIHAM